MSTTAPQPSPLDEARASELESRNRLAALVTERARAEREAARLRDRADLPGADPGVSGAAEAQQQLAAALGTRIEAVRRVLRAQEGLVATLEAEADRSRSAGA